MKIFQKDVYRFHMMGVRYGFQPDPKEITLKYDDWKDILEALDELLKLRAENKKLKSSKMTNANDKEATEEILSEQSELNTKKPKPRKQR